MISENLSINRDVVAEYAEKFKVCPFEMGLDASYWCDGIICDYNYCFDPNVALKRYFGSGTKNDYIFLVDEAHNLVDRAREMYSATLVKEHLMEAKKLLTKDKENTDKRLVSNFERTNKLLLSFKRECDELKVLGGTESLGRLPEYLTYLSDGILGFLDKHKNFADRKELLEFFFEVNHFLNMYDCLDDKYVVYTEHDSDGDFCVHLYCVDPSGNLSERLESARSTVFFSATLLPVNFFKEMLTGNVDDYAIYAESSFPRERRKILIGRDVSSRYTRRNDAEYKKICSYIAETIAVHSGNYMVFFPSYAYMQNVYEMYTKLYAPIELTEETTDITLINSMATKVIIQKNDMRETDREWFLNVFNDTGMNGSLVGFCVAGGMFSEGIDLRDESLVGAIIVGTGLPMICRHRDLLKDYFNGRGKDGFDYAYVYPGMNKVLQAAGRVIRTSSDAGVIELLDDRFLKKEQQYLFPREWGDVEITDKSTLSKKLTDFWKKLVQ
jgi:Rad3-related DNA helicase